MVLSSEKNLYEILEIDHFATDITIKSAYRKLARKYHPDLNGGDKECCTKFKEITEAYEILSDIEKKKNYDLLKGFRKETSYTRRTEANRAYQETKNMEQESQESANAHKKNDTSQTFSNIFNDIMEGFRNTTSNSRNQTFKNKPQPENGSDVYTDVSITVLEAINGTTRKLNVLHTEACTNCSGRPFMNGAKCPHCEGHGEKSAHKKIVVKIPANVRHGSKIRIANEGNKGINGGKNGDLYLNIKVNNDSTYKYQGLNVLYTLPITPFEAALGATIDIPTPNGKVAMKIAPNTCSGQKLRLAGQGLVKDGQKGDMIITVNIEIPNNLSKEEIRLYEQLKNISKSNIRENQ